jgi:molecular chaperone GrpE
MTRHRIPVRVGTTPVSTRSVYPEAPEAADQAQQKRPEQAPRGSPEQTQQGSREQAQRGSPEQVQRGLPEQAQRGSSDPRFESATQVSTPAYSVSKENENSISWRDRALRLQAEMDNYRKRQRRVAQEEAQADQERLLHEVLRVADNLDRTLDAEEYPNVRGTSDRRDAGALRRGVELTRDELLHILAGYGIERFEALGKPFDPAWHEAVHVVSARALGVEPGTVVEQLQPGYRKHEAVYGERLFRPARVVVAN